MTDNDRITALAAALLLARKFITNPVVLAQIDDTLALIDKELA